MYTTSESMSFKAHTSEVSPRVHIVWFIAKVGGEVYAKDIEREVGIKPSALRREIETMRREGVIRQDGGVVRLAYAPLTPLHDDEAHTWARLWGLWKSTGMSRPIMSADVPGTSLAVIARKGWAEMRRAARWKGQPVFVPSLAAIAYEAARERGDQIIR